MIARYNNMSLALGVPGILLQIYSVAFLNPETDAMALPLRALGTLLLIAGLAMYAKAKGRSPAWGLFGFLSLIGLVVLALLEDRSNGSRRQY